MSGFGIGATWRWPVRRVRIRRNRDAVEADETFIGRKEGAETPKGGYSHEHAVLALWARRRSEGITRGVPDAGGASARTRRAGGDATGAITLGRAVRGPRRASARGEHGIRGRRDRRAAGSGLARLGRQQACGAALHRRRQQGVGRHPAQVGQRPSRYTRLATRPSASADARDLPAAALVRVIQKPPILTQQGEVGFFDREFFSGFGRFSAQRDPVPEHEPTPPDPPLGPVDGGVELRKGRGTWRGGVLHGRAFVQFGSAITPELVSVTATT